MVYRGTLKSALHCDMLAWGNLQCAENDSKVLVWRSLHKPTWMSNIQNRHARFTLQIYTWMSISIPMYKDDDKISDTKGGKKPKCLKFICFPPKMTPHGETSSSNSNDDTYSSCDKWFGSVYQIAKACMKRCVLFHQFNRLILKCITLCMLCWCEPKLPFISHTWYLLTTTKILFALQQRVRT